MASKRTIVITSLLALVASVTSLIGFSYAWFNHNRVVSNTLVFSSGDKAAQISAHVYRKDIDNPDNPPEVAYYRDDIIRLNAVKNTSSSEVGSLVVDFSTAIYVDFDMLTAYYDEHAISTLVFPEYFLEIKFMKEVHDAFFKGKIVFSGLPVATSAEIDYGITYPFEYRQLIAENNNVDLFTSGIPTFLDSLNAVTSRPFFGLASERTDGIDLFTIGDLEGAPLNLDDPTLAPQLFVNNFHYYGTDDFPLFSETLMISLKINPEHFLSFVQDNPDIATKPLRFGVNFRLDFEYSNDPFYLGGV